MIEQARKCGFGAAIIGLLLVAHSTLASAQTLQITSPSNGTVVTPGQMLTVTVSDNPSGSFSQVLIISQNPIGSSPVMTSEPFQFSLTIPSTITPGLYSLTASGIFTQGGGADSDPVTIDVEPAASLISVSVDPSVINFSAIGQQVPLGVTGNFGDGSTADITESSQTTYSSIDPTVASVSAAGLVTAVGPGYTHITIDSYYNIPVTVPSAAAASSATPTATATATATATQTATSTPTATATPTATPTPMLPPASISVAPTKLSFPVTGVGAPPTMKSFTIRNLSKSNLLSGQIVVPPGPFGATPNGSFAVQARHSAKIEVSFTPTDSMSHTVEIAIDSNDPAHPTVNVSVSGTGEAGVLSAPPSVKFPPTHVGAKISRSVTLRNRGKGTLTGTIPSPGGSFAVSPVGSFEIPAGRTLPLAIDFTPSTTGSIASAVQISVDVPGAPQPGVTIQLSGTGK